VHHERDTAAIEWIENEERASSTQLTWGFEEAS